MERNLDTLKEALWVQFETASKNTNRYEDSYSAGSHTPSNFAIANRQAMAQLAQGIVAIEKEQRVSKEAQGMRFDKG